MSITSRDAQKYIGQILNDSNGDKIGKIGAVFLDDVTGQHEWVTVSTGFFGSKETFVPIEGATPQDDDLRVPYSKDTVKDAPNVDLDEGHLSSDEEAELYRYYEGGTGTAESRTTRSTQDDVDASTTSHSRSETAESGPETGTLTRSEEKLNVGTETAVTGKARLRRWVETEHQSVDVPIRREKVRLETEPITDADRDGAAIGSDLSEDEHEITLTEERPVVTTEAVPVEKVRIGKEVEESSTTVEADVRKERIDLDADQEVRNRD